MNDSITANNIYKIKMGDRVFDVKIADIHARPVIAVVDGVEFEIWPQSENGVHPVAAPSPASQPASTARTAPAPAAPEPGVLQGDPNQVLAPIPGVILSVAVLPGTEVTAGQELLTLEAMKMKNKIRAVRSGKISAIHVAPGQAVRHKDLLLEYEESGDGLR